MSRCNICDYLDGYGSSLTNTPASTNMVRWNSEYGDYICRECADSIGENLRDISPPIEDGELEHETEEVLEDNPI